MNVNRFLVTFGIAMACVNASAAQILIKTSGVFTAGSYDRIGLFAPSGTDLAGYDYQFEVALNRDLAEYNFTVDRYDSISLAPVSSYSMMVNGIVVSQRALTYEGADVFFFKNDDLSGLSLVVNAAGSTSNIGMGLSFWAAQDARFSSELLPDALRIGMSIDHQVAPSDYQVSQVLFYNWDFIFAPDSDPVNAYSLLFTQVHHVSMSTIREPSSNVLVGLGIAGAAFITRRSRGSRRSR